MNSFKGSLVVLLAVWSLATGPAPSLAQDEAVQTAIEQQMSRLSKDRALTLRGAAIAEVWFLPEFYERRGYRPAWTEPANVEALLAAIEASPADGLDPEDFLQSTLQQLQQETAAGGAMPADLAAERDILLSDALVRLGYQLFYGKVDPADLDANWNLERPLLGKDAADLIDEALASKGIDQLIQVLAVGDPIYADMKSLLARYREIERQGGWEAIPEGPAIEPGSEDPRVPALRRRLAVTGDYDGAQQDSPLYDAALEAAVKGFQARHDLEADGVVGAKSLEALNRPVQARIDQIRVNLERARWVLRDLQGDFVIVNIAGFRTYLVRGGEVVWETRSVVGLPYRKTPIFKDEISYLEFNPTWTVPPGILAKSLLPKVKEDPSYLTANNFGLIDGNGKRVDPASVDWAKIKAKGFPYSMVQAPGPENALGLVKFMFPNKHLVYLHDTPARDLFERSERAFSSGCVRLKDPFDLAELLLADLDGWDRQKIDAVVRSGETQRVELAKPMPVLLLYWTVNIDDDGSAQFKTDVYERDGPLLAALDGEFQPKPDIETGQQ